MLFRSLRLPKPSGYKAFPMAGRSTAMTAKKSAILSVIRCSEIQSLYLAWHILCRAYIIHFQTRKLFMLELVPISLRTANDYVCKYHRHHGRTAGHKFSIGVQSDNQLVGVAICGRPVSRFLDDGLTLEVNRVCTDGTKNACSMLYGAAIRAAKAMGYHRVITYTLDTEPGTSLKASGFSCDGQAGGLEWTGARKPSDENLYPHQMKTRWIKNLKREESV